MSTGLSAAASVAHRPTREEVRRLARDHDLVPVVREVLADCDTPVSAFLRLGESPGSFLLESVEGGERLARWSFLGGHPLATITLDAHGLEVEDAGGSRRRDGDPLAMLAQEVATRRAAPLPAGVDVPFRGGAVGWLAYEAATCFERLPVAAEDPLGLPLGWFALCDTLIAFDHVTHRMLLLSHARTGPGADPDAAYDAAVERIEDMRRRLHAPLPEEREPEVDVPAAEVSTRFSRAEFVAAVERCREYILAGDIFQVQVGRRFAVPLRATPFELYRALRSINPSPYMFYLATPPCAVVGASPEMLVRVTGRRVEYHPIAGTRRRGRDARRDAELEAELRASEKERAEHLMLVDLGRNDLGRVCEVGSVRVTEFMEVERYSHVMHLVSSIEGVLHPELAPVDALRACFPAGTVTGAPKIRAMEVIAELEPQTRGVYAGAAGYVGFDGGLDTAIALRTLVVKDGIAYAQASAGIVADSTSAEEALEIDNKVAALLAAVDMAGRGLQR